jgi:hypothetical protein
MLVNTQYFSPVILNGIPQFQKNSFDWDKYWEEEMRRCIHGYRVGDVYITGPYYFYLNWWKIKRTGKGATRKQYGNPRFTQLDFEFFNLVEEARQKGKFIVLVKRRQCGFSEKAAALAAYEYTFYPSSQTVVVAGESKYCDDTMLKAHKGLAELKNTEWTQRFSGNLAERIARWKPKGEQEYVGNKGELHSISCWTNAQATIGKSPSLILFEEAGKFKNLIASFNYIKPALFAENGRTTGMALIWGTGGEMDSGADQLKEIFYHPEAYNCLAMDDIYSEDWDPEFIDDRPKVGWFVPAWKFSIIDKDGNDLKSESLTNVMDRREIAKDSSDPKTLMNEITQSPIFVEEAFLIQGKNRFNTGLLNRRLIEIRKSKGEQEKKKTGILEWVYDEVDIKLVVGVKFTEEHDGWCHIWEEPVKIPTDPNDPNSATSVPDFLYTTATDSWDKPEVTDFDGASKGSCGVLKGFLTIGQSSDKFVARITERTSDPDSFYEHTAMLNVYYNGVNLIEYSNYGIFKWYKANNFEHLLRERPEVVNISMVDSKVQNKYGVDPQSKDYWIGRLAVYIEKNWNKFDDEQQIERLIMYKEEKGYNCDITIQSALNIIHLEDNKYFGLTVDSPEKSKNNTSVNTFGKRLSSNFYVVKDGQIKKNSNGTTTESVNRSKRKTPRRHAL